ncbi:hypothetical protein RHGRI_030625 [Rhododendron griersonianum]|uniref:Uncharacterized protein n=2 Tax=Rhododendron griersonianum TaxID=479676 RepID=A0AAV6I5J5_9ERIC|nr:hypothetical protein RHGRI_030625 [Rhododendron griersonianum]
MSNKKQGGCPPFSPRVLANYRSLLVPEYTGPTPLPEDDMELYEVPITWEIPPPAVNHEYLPPTEIPTPHVEDFEQPFSFPMYDIETNPELEAAILDHSQYYLEPLEEPPVLTKEEFHEQGYKLLEEVVARAKRDYKKILREMFGIVLL